MDFGHPKRGRDPGTNHLQVTEGPLYCDALGVNNEKLWNLFNSRDIGTEHIFNVCL